MAEESDAEAATGGPSVAKNAATVVRPGVENGSSEKTKLSVDDIVDMCNGRGASNRNVDDYKSASSSTVGTNVQSDKVCVQPPGPRIPTPHGGTILNSTGSGCNMLSNSTTSSGETPGLSHNNIITSSISNASTINPSSAPPEFACSSAPAYIGVLPRTTSTKSNIVTQDDRDAGRMQIPKSFTTPTHAGIASRGAKTSRSNKGDTNKSSSQHKRSGGWIVNSVAKGLETATDAMLGSLISSLMPKSGPGVVSGITI